MDRHIGAQLYTLRDFCQDAKGFEETMQKLQKIGYSVLQVSGVGDIPAKTMGEIAESYGMKVVCTHKGLSDFRQDIGGVIKYNRELGSPLAGLGHLPGGEAKTLEDVKNLIREFNAFSKILKAEGLTFGFHNHALEFTKIGGKTIFEYLMDETDPEICFIVDTYWAAVGGIAPEKLIRRLGKRAMAIHFKDLKIDFGNAPVMAEILEGNLDWDDIIKACDEAGSLWALVEQDICPGNPFDSMALSYNNLKKKGFC
jgi:sugar phosphate isomerase/epimerase